LQSDDEGNAEFDQSLHECLRKKLILKYAVNFTTKRKK
jgi:hypothetical protein